MTSSKFLFSVFDVTRQGEQPTQDQLDHAERVQSFTRRPSPSVSSISNRYSPVVSDSTSDALAGGELMDQTSSSSLSGWYPVYPISVRRKCPTSSSLCSMSGEYWSGHLARKL
jgi:hypothetical protein